MEYITIGILALLLLLIVLIVLGIIWLQRQDPPSSPTTGISGDRCSGAVGEMQNLWREHVEKTREFILADVNNNPQLPQVTNDLLYNQTQLGNNYARFYGKEKGSQYHELLEKHIQQAAEIVNTAKAGSNTTFIVNEWYGNADDIARFLTSTNTRLDYQTMRTHMFDHLDLTLKEATASIQGNEQESLKWYNQAQEEAKEMSQYISTGLC